MKKKLAQQLTGKDSFSTIKGLKAKEAELRKAGYSFVRKGNKSMITPVPGKFHGLSWCIDDDGVLVYYYTPSETVYNTYYKFAKMRYNK